MKYETYIEFKVEVEFRPDGPDDCIVDEITIKDERLNVPVVLSPTQILSNKLEEEILEEKNKHRTKNFYD